MILRLFSSLTITLAIDSVEANVNGHIKDVEVAARIINNRTYVPLRFVAESTGAVVKWNGETKTASIYYEKQVKEKDYSIFTVDELLKSIYQKTKDQTQIKTDERG